MWTPELTGSSHTATRGSPTSATSPPSTGRGFGDRTSSAGAALARTFRSLVPGRGWPMAHDPTFGSPCARRLRNLNQPTLYGRMYVEHCQPEPKATWDGRKDCWMADPRKPTRRRKIPLYEHWGVFSETFPTSGTMRDGSLYELPTWGPATGASGSSLSPTPRATRGGSSTEIDLLS